MVVSVIVPVAVLAVAAWGITRLLCWMMPEGVAWLFVIALLAGTVLTGVSAAGFFLLYGPAGEVVLGRAPWHFVVLSAKATLIWGPVTVLTLADAPRRWKTAVW